MENVDWQTNKSSSECHKYILEHEVDCDISFEVGDDKEIIKAHKFILRTRSIIFDKMFNGSFRESKTDPVIGLPDVRPAAFKTLLRYCYYDCLDIKGDVALVVLHAAKKYMLPILETAARKTLMNKLNKTNLLEVMQYAATTGEKELDTYCRNKFKENLSDSNILDVTRYVVTKGDTELKATCKAFLKEHLSVSTIWEVYTYALNDGDTAVQQHCREYFEKDIPMVREALQSADFPNIQYEVLLDVLHINDKVDKAVDIGSSPGISISEIELFTACNKWAEAECLRQPNGTTKRKVLGECLSLIRFPTMLQKDLTTVVFPTGILTQAGIVNLGWYIGRDPGSHCQVDFPSKERQFVVRLSGDSTGGNSTSMIIESEHRVMLSRLWTLYSGNYTVTVKDERSKRLWSMPLDTKHEKHVTMDQESILYYLDVDPEVLEAGTRYTVTVQRNASHTAITKQPGVEYTKIRSSRTYTKLKITRRPNDDYRIAYLTLQLI